MWFFTSLYRSLFDFRWLKERRNNPGQSWSYFFLLVFLLSGLVLIPLFLQMPSSLKELRSLADKKMPYFQAELKEGVLKISELEQPYVLKEKDFVFVVDTVSESTQLSNWLEDDSFSGILITSDRAEVYNGVKKTSQVQFWKNLPDYRTDKNEILNLMDKWFRPAVVYLFGMLMFVILFIGLTVSKLITLVIVSALVLLISNFYKKEWTFKQLFSVGLFALTLPSILVVVLGGIGAQVSFLYSLILLGLMLAIVFVKNNREVIS